MLVACTLHTLNQQNRPSKAQETDKDSMITVGALMYDASLVLFDALHSQYTALRSLQDMSMSHAHFESTKSAIYSDMKDTVIFLVH